MSRAREKAPGVAPDGLDRTNSIPQPPISKRLSIVLPVRFVEKGYEANRVVNGRMKKNISAASLDVLLELGFGPYLKARDEWPENVNVDIVFAMNIELNPEEEELDDFLKSAVKEVEDS